MINRIVKMTFEKGNEATFESLFDSIKQKVRHQPGCLHLELWKDTYNPSIYFTFSQWASQKDLDNYRHTPLFEKVWKETKALFGDKAAAWSVKQLTVVDKN